MAGTFGGFEGLADAIRSLDFAQGHMDNIVKAAIRPVAEGFEAAISDPSVWPEYSTDGNRPPSKRKDAFVPLNQTTPVRLGVPHSGERWTILPLPNGWAVSNPAPYVTYIHDNVSGAQNLLKAQAAPLFTFAAEQGLALVTGRVTELFAGKQ